jgi:cell division protein FtsL
MPTFPFATDQVEVVTGVLTVMCLIVAAIGLFLTVYSIQQASKLASEDRKAALEQAQKDLRWRQTVEAQRAIRNA